MYVCGLDRMSLYLAVINKLRNSLNYRGAFPTSQLMSVGFLQKAYFYFSFQFDTISLRGCSFIPQSCKFPIGCHKSDVLIPSLILQILTIFVFSIHFCSQIQSTDH